MATEKESPITYELKDNIQVLDFHTSHQEQQYLLIIGEQRFEINEGIASLIRMLEKNSSAEILAEEYAQLKGVDCSAEEFALIIEEYIRPHGLLKESAEEATEESKKSSYIYWQVEFLPAKVIDPIVKRLAFLYNKQLFNFLFPALILSHILFFVFVAKVNFSVTDQPISAIILLYSIYMISFLFHEFGHATASHKYGAKFGNIGFGLYLYFPVLFADVSDAWRLNRRQRTIVDIGGIYFHMIFNAVLFLIYLCYPVTFISFLISIISLAIVFNLNPFFRFDGYWIYSDLIGVPNLRQRSFELVNYLYRKIRRLPVNKRPYLFQIKRREQFFLLFYALISNLFFAYIFYRIPIVLYRLILGYPKIFMDCMQIAGDALRAGDTAAAGMALKALLTPTVLLFIFSFFIFRILKRFIKSPFKRLPQQPTPQLST